MAKAKINEINVINNDLKTPTFKKVVTSKAPGNHILVEFLNEHELIDSNLILGGEVKPSTQGYILDVGPLVNKDFGFVVGMRVLIQGSYTKVPSTNNSSRVVGSCYPDIVKAILNEE